jgi:hypothetical protein
VQLVTVLRSEEQLRYEPALDHVGRAPLARYLDVVAEVPGEVVGEALRPAIDLPSPEDVERVVVEQENPTGTFAVRHQVASLDVRVRR